jgi:methyl-accepting chemotaxis protein
MNQITQQNASSSEELAATAEEMTGQTGHLQQLMRFFKTPTTAAGSGSAAAAAGFARRPLVSGKVPTQHKWSDGVPRLDEAKFDRF